MAIESWEWDGNANKSQYWKWECEVMKRDGMGVRRNGNQKNPFPIISNRVCKGKLIGGYLSRE